MGAGRKKRLRSGFTTGACAAAAAKAAAMLVAGYPAPTEVEIPFPDGSRHRFAIHRVEQNWRHWRNWRNWGQAYKLSSCPRSEPEGKLGSDTNFHFLQQFSKSKELGGRKLVSDPNFLANDHQGRLFGASVTAAVIKDAGDDPDVTNGAQIEATVAILSSSEMAELEAGAGDFVFLGSWNQLLSEDRLQVNSSQLSGVTRQQMAASGDVAYLHSNPALAMDPAVTGVWLGRGVGVGMVSKPGLAIAPGQPAINPVPRQMIAAAVAEVWAGQVPPSLAVSIAVPDGEKLALKTLNRRLGIIGGLSILGTTGIVRPVSAEAWTATIAASLDVARAAGLRAVILSTGRTSERGVQQLLQLPEEACAMMGDYLQFSLQEAGKRGFSRIHLAGMWAKIVKAALKVPQTHVRNGALEVRQATALLAELGAEAELVVSLNDANTAREIYLRLEELGRTELIGAVCRRAAEYAATTAGVPVTLYLVGSHAQVITTAESEGVTA